MKHKNPWSPLFVTNFVTVFNDNLLKWLVCFISIKWVSDVSESTVIAIASAMLVLPFIFLSPLAGKLSVVYSKKKVLYIGKLAELPIMIVAVLGFMFQSLYVVMTAVLLLGIQSSLFSPSKYGLIRDVGGEQGISYGTGSMEMLTFFGVLLGTFGASVLSDNYNFYLISGLLLSIAVIGIFSTRSIKAHEPEASLSYKGSVNPITYIRYTYGLAKEIKGLNYVILGLAFFWLVGALLQMDLKVYCSEILNLGDTETGIVMVIAAVGIGFGCFVTGIISKQSVRIRLVPIGAAGMLLFFALIYIVQPTTILFSIFIFLSAFLSGVYKIPLNAWIQTNVKGRTLGDILAYQNIAEFGFILFSSAIFFFFDASTVFLVLFLLTLFISVLLYFKIPGLRKPIAKL